MNNPQILLLLELLQQNKHYKITLKCSLPTPKEASSYQQTLNETLLITAFMTSDVKLMLQYENI